MIHLYLYLKKEIFYKNGFIDYRNNILNLRLKLLDAE